MSGKVQPEKELPLIVIMLPLLKIASCCRKVAAGLGVSPFPEAHSHGVSPLVPDIKSVPQNFLATRLFCYASSCFMWGAADFRSDGLDFCLDLCDLVKVLSEHYMQNWMS